MKQMKSYRLRTTTRLQLDELTEKYQCTETELVEKGIDLLEIIMLLESQFVNPVYYCKTITGKKIKLELVGDESV